MCLLHKRKRDFYTLSETKKPLGTDKRREAAFALLANDIIDVRMRGKRVPDLLNIFFCTLNS
jgi:hypothetical protein